MRFNYIFLGLLLAIAVSCTMDEVAAPDEPTCSPSKIVFHATIDDQPNGLDTRTFSDDQLRVLWNKDDRITIFNKVTSGVEYYFTGDDSDAGGDFNEVKGEEGSSPTFSGGSEMDYIYAVYPHQKDTKISHDGVITFTLPEVQYYYANSFGKGANTMVAKSTNTVLRFKNTGGYLSFWLYGNNITVSSVILKANGKAAPALAGKCTLEVMSDGLPKVTMNNDNVTNEVRLYCKDPVKLGSSAQESTEFRFVLPPVDFLKENGGFTIIVTTPDGGVFTKTAKRNLTIERNTLYKMDPVEVTIPEDQSCEIEISGISSDKNHKTEYVEDTRSFTITIPTVTDFSNLVLNYDLESGDKLMVDGKEVVSGVTPIDASGKKPVTLMVCRDYAEKRYTLVAQNTGLPVVKITTDGFTLADLESYKNSQQNLAQGSRDTIDSRIWLPETVGAGTFIRIENPDGSPGMMDGDNPVYEVALQIKGRGNVTWQYPKKPYALKFDKKREVLGMSRHNRWILLANWRDRTLLRNDAAFWVSKRTGLPYTVSGQFVELEINGEHRGNYYLCEQIKIDKNRVNITEMKKTYTDKSGGFLMEIDSYFDELRKFRSNEFNLRYMFKDPDVDAKTDTFYNGAYAWMKDYINRFEKVVKTKSGVVNHQYEDYLDVDSAIWFMLVNEVTENRDFFQGMPESVYGPHSSYLYKDKGGKLFMGPVWDFDYETFVPAEWFNNSWGNGSYAWRGFDKSGYYYYYLCYDKKFRDRVQELWGELKADDVLKKDFRAYINTMASKISLSQEFDDKMWPYIGNHQSGVLSQQNDNHDYTLSFKDAIKRMEDSFDARVDWMDSKIQNLQQTNPNFKY